MRRTPPAGGGRAAVAARPRDVGGTRLVLTP